MLVKTRSAVVVPLFFCLSGLVSAAFAQAPSISGTSPQAARPGQTVDVKVRGGNLAGATELWTSFPSQVAMTPDVKDNGKNNAEVTYRVTVPAEASPGIYGIRVGTAKGVSPLKLFVVDDLPSVAQQGSNTSPAAAQAVTLPIAVDGTMSALGRHYYKFPARAGQKVSCEVLARRIGSALDPLIRLLDASGRELTYNDDAPGLSADSQFCYTIPSNGEYIVEIRDIRYQGGGNYFYRLRMGDFPCVNVPYPMGAKRGTEATLTFAGSHVEGVQPFKVAIPGNADVNWINVSARRAGGQSSGFAVLSVGSSDEFVETEPNDTPDKANRAQLGAGLNGRLDKAGDSDRFIFAAKKGQKFSFAAITRQQGSPSDLLLRLFKADGGKVSEAEDSGTMDGVINYTFPADGDYTLQVVDLNRRGGSAFAYRIAVTESRPGFSLSVTADKLNVPAGGTVAVTVNAARSGYKGEIAVSIEGLPQGITATPTVIGAGRNSVVFTVTAAANAAAGKIAAIRIVGKASIGGAEYRAVASAAAVIKAAGNAMPWAPEVVATDTAMAVAPAQPIALRIEPASIVFGRGLQAKVKVVVQRKKDYNEAITLALTPAKNGLPAGVTAALKPIPAGKNEIEIVFTANDKAALGSSNGGLVATLKKGKTTVAQPVPSVGLKLQAPFALKTDTAGGKLAKGGQLKIKVIADRNPAFTGAITLTLQNLPKGVSPTTATIPAGQNEVEIQLTAKDDAQVGAINNLTVKGDATVGKAKLTGTSAAVGLTVE